jgi:hypothetical protein
VNFAATKTTGWQKNCLDWAKAKQPFVIYGIEKTHMLFCQELCAAYKFKCRFFCKGSVAVFAPANGN